MVGALFALSFDTVSQAALFAVAGVQAGGWQHALGLGLVFMAGMLLADGANGLWLARLIARADSAARIASRVMAVAVAGVSLLVAAHGAARLVLPGLEAWARAGSCARRRVIAVVFASFLLGLHLRAAVVCARAWSEHRVRDGSLVGAGASRCERVAFGPYQALVVKSTWCLIGFKVAMGHRWHSGRACRAG
jgi:hypothetical protein